MDAIVADGGREPGFHIARLEQIPLPGEVTPDPGEAVGLELDANGDRVAPRLARAGPLLPHLLRDSQLLLNVMADFVGDHVGARELARRSKPLRERFEEGPVEIDVAIGRTVEWADSRAGQPTRRIDRAPKQHKPGRVVLAAHLSEERLPGVLRVAQDYGGRTP